MFSDIMNIGSKKTSLSKILLFFYIIMASSYTNSLMGMQMKHFLKDNRLMQHIIAFLGMIVLITVVGDIDDSRIAVLYAAIGYTWFILTTKLDVHWNVIILALLFVGYMYENELDIKNNNIKDDPNMPKYMKNKIIKDNITNKIYIVSTIMVITLIGTLMYINKKQTQYGGNFNLLTYMFY